VIGGKFLGWVVELMELKFEFPGNSDLIGKIPIIC